ncbi:MAG: signal peptidase I [Candidatus Liptonbacteria bacterium CG11_big_fil_rev_8_21_14_0_20_35_14]|uniref:Signal peptidase I n=1 Tax=Candidatus Liptonbacteria bacterium CG11_big_fil_rev_8_21_14_0_20_35_14 TaxID=1974634 RepID=A0A2H0N8K9_9BACT|nr:MAG: signal peptidase I [Candidatus Liptonbacteria bacterium CG11_big_fil_rev_8_21_14_0_20_35_14]
MRLFFSALIEVLEVVLVAVISVLIIKNFLVQPFLVSGDSMEPNFSNGNYLLVDEVTYRFREPERGEVVVFRYPGDNKVFYIKRIIGLPGETVTVKDNKVMVLNKSEIMVLSESYIPPTSRTSGEVEYVLDQNHYFVLGDNRLYSFDSRNWGPLDRGNILGVVRLNLWPLNEVRAIEEPLYNIN